MRKRVIGILLIISILVTSIILPGEKVEAASKYINVKTFIQYLAEAMKLPLPKDFPEPYIAAVVTAGILTGYDFDNNFTRDITRTDVAVLLNRADEYLHGDTVNADLLKVVLEKRISDIKKVPEGKREAVVKCFAKGIFQGEFNGYNSLNRSFKGTEKLTKKEVTALINKVLKPSKRAKLSPDGQLIRTTNLPKYAKYYPYVLASYPNKYYDWQFQFEGQAKVNPETMKATPYKNIEEYAAPVDMDKIKDFDNFKKVKSEYLDEWVGKVQTYMECVFNADYRTINDKWVNKILSADYSSVNDIYIASTQKEIKQYITAMKKNKTIVESSKIAVDGSSLYYFDGRYILRVYVKYRIVSSNLKYGVDVDTLIYENPYSKILYTSYPMVNLINYKIGEWKESYFDVEMGWVTIKDPSNIGVIYAVLNELLYEKRRIDK